ncbi:MAG: hypothetical protein H7Z74_00615 [Anaerolineae bacterium]|nr:hypothetical protein [Gemmatimonadaceae bacterium]
MSRGNQDSVAESQGSGAASSEQATVFSVLRERSRETPLAALGAAFLFGAVDAVMIVIASPSLWWLAAGFVSFAAYGCWGVSDRMLSQRTFGWRRATLRSLRLAALTLGCAAALAMLLGLMRSALAGWIL